uniref:FP protein C-terminal domain-containing protein n=1 Tax=Clytia hemisphaerica TaxID=252671 RepID=A0A7M5UKD5_9CNID
KKLTDMETNYKSTKSEIQSISTNVANLANNFNKMKIDLDNVIKSQDFISKEYDKQNLLITGLQTQITDIKKGCAETKLVNKNLAKTCTDLRTELEKEKSALNDLQQYSRRNMVDIHGIPRLNREDTDKLVTVLAGKMGLTLLKSDIEISHRTHPGANAPIIVKFLSRGTRNAFFDKRKNLRNIRVRDLGDHFGDCGHKIYVNESLTTQNVDIFKAAKNKFGRNNKYIWTHHGITFMKKDDRSDKIMLKSMTDVVGYVTNSNNNNIADTDQESCKPKFSLAY